MWQGIKNIYHLFVAFAANVWFGFPSKKLIVIGVTGTDGKTTTVSLIYHILNQAGYNTSMVSSIGARIGGEEYSLPFHVTTPSPWQLQRFFKKAVEEKGALLGNENFLVLEVTSHALDQNRVFGIDFEVGVLTNVTHEHLDYHKTYEGYLKTKVKLLGMAKVAVVNKDDSSSEVISDLKYKTSNIKWMTYGMGKNADINPKIFPFVSKLIGEFNKYNVLAAVGACRALGVSPKHILSGIASFEAPIGREEVVYQNSFVIMIDFAHTPNAIDMVLQSIRRDVKGRIIHVFGSAGKRDASKRPLMGKASSKYADIIILTAEDPRGESVDKIMNEIESGIKNQESRIKNGSLLRIEDRKEAINMAISMAKKGDLVILTGKAHEKSMNYGKGEEPWDEYQAVKNALKLRNNL